MKHILSILLSLVCLPAFANLHITDLMSVISCNSVADKHYFTAMFTKQYGTPTSKEGALWFKGDGDMYGARVREVFVSNTDKLTFVGVVLESPPESVLKVMQSSRLYPTTPFPRNGYWVGSDGRHIMWHAGKYTKMFCTVSQDR